MAADTSTTERLGRKFASSFVILLFVIAVSIISFHWFFSPSSSSSSALSSSSSSSSFSSSSSSSSSSNYVSSSDSAPVNWQFLSRHTSSASARAPSRRIVLTSTSTTPTTSSTSTTTSSSGYDNNNEDDDEKEGDDTYNGKEEDLLARPLRPSPAEREWRERYRQKFRQLGAGVEFLTWLVEQHQHQQQQLQQQQQQRQQMKKTFSNQYQEKEDDGDSIIGDGGGGVIPPWRPGRATPITCPSLAPTVAGNENDNKKKKKARRIYSGYYSIPPSSSSFSSSFSTHHRPQDWSRVIPGVKKTYVFSGSEEGERNYTRDLRRSKFAINFRKGGWATARLLELMAAGTIPYFCDIPSSPRRGTLQNLPREFLASILWLPGISTNCQRSRRFVRAESFSRPPFNDTLAAALGAMLQRYTRQSLRAPYVARYMLSATSLRRVPRRVLVLWVTPVHAGYLMPTFMMGMKRLGAAVVDYPRKDILYQSPGCRQRAARLWGKGYFSFCRMDESAEELRLRRESDDQIRDKLRQRFFDVVLIHLPHESYLFKYDPTTAAGQAALRRSGNNNNPLVLPGLLFFNETIANYPRHRVLFVHDGDMLYDMGKDYGYDAVSRYGRYMRRETHGCGEEIWGSRLATPRECSVAAFGKEVCGDAYP